MSSPHSGECGYREPQMSSILPATPQQVRFPKARRRIIPAVSGAVAVLLGLFLGTGGFTFYYANGGSYLSNDPKACINCHIMREQYDGWQKSSHHAVAVCNDCHTPHDFVGKWLTKATNGYHHSRAFTFQDFHEPIQITPRNADVLNRACLHCHGELTSLIRLVGHESLRTELSEEMTCVRCHQTVGHGPRD